MFPYQYQPRADSLRINFIFRIRMKVESISVKLLKNLNSRKVVFALYFCTQNRSHSIGGAPANLADMQLAGRPCPQCCISSPPKVVKNTFIEVLQLFFQGTDYKFDMTPCDSHGGRWRVQVPTWTGALQSCQLKLPTRINTCGN